MPQRDGDQKHRPGRRHLRFTLSRESRTVRERKVGPAAIASFMSHFASVLRLS
jgi:hypothetical protein